MYFYDFFQKISFISSKWDSKNFRKFFRRFSFYSVKTNQCIINDFSVTLTIDSIYRNHKLKRQYLVTEKQ